MIGVQESNHGKGSFYIFRSKCPLMRTHTSAWENGKGESANPIHVDAEL